MIHAPTGCAVAGRKVTQRTKPASLDKILDEQTKRFIHECLEHDNNIRPSATALLSHMYLAPPFGGPGTEDDIPVALVPKEGNSSTSQRQCSVSSFQRWHSMGSGKEKGGAWRSSANHWPGAMSRFSAYNARATT